ncbi:Uronyl 2-sulfotransferase [Triplophysa tibetana]|uniref:Uronyl 2-sulfotransferase n=1 Tax=Triplophysa tibetana TaxID=1572043 RepID=A0A5A9NI06_9TELE|nr:Uronyl 2-sulfotransferase [Triplophysa tibetana]
MKHYNSSPRLNNQTANHSRERNNRKGFWLSTLGLRFSLRDYAYCMATLLLFCLGSLFYQLNGGPPTVLLEFRQYLDSLCTHQRFPRSGYGCQSAAKRTQTLSLMRTVHVCAHVYILNDVVSLECFGLLKMRERVALCCGACKQRIPIQTIRAWTTNPLPNSLKNSRAQRCRDQSHWMQPTTGHPVSCSIPKTVQKVSCSNPPNHLPCQRLCSQGQVALSQLPLPLSQSPIPLQPPPCQPPSQWKCSQGRKALSQRPFLLSHPPSQLQPPPSRPVGQGGMTEYSDTAV